MVVRFEPVVSTVLADGYVRNARISMERAELVLVYIIFILDIVPSTE